MCFIFEPINLKKYVSIVKERWGREFYSDWDNTVNARMAKFNVSEQGSYTSQSKWTNCHSGAWYRPIDPTHQIVFIAAQIDLGMIYLRLFPGVPPPPPRNGIYL